MGRPVLGGGAEGGVVVVAEVFVAKAGAAAAATVDEDVAALEAAGLGRLRSHLAFRVKCESPAGAGLSGNFTVWVSYITAVKRFWG
jgi:hypothetical protein